MPDWTTACPDWERRIVAGESLIPFAPLFPSEAAAALDVLGELRIVDALGSPTFAQSSRPWVTDFAAAIFGALDPLSGRRLIREFLLLISKKNGKSTDAAGIMLTALCRNFRQSGEFYVLAPTKEVADNSFFPARDMVKAHPELSEMIHIKENERTLIHRLTRAFLKVVAADAETVSGKKTIGILIDELWLFGKRANAASMLREATGGVVSRPEGFVIYSTTQSDEPPAGVFKEKLEYFRNVRDGLVVDPRSLAVLYEFPPPMIAAKAYLDPKNFYVTNPNLGLSVDEEWLRDELAKAQLAGDHALNVHLAKHLNVEIGQNLRADRWAGADFWETSVDPTLTLESLIKRCDCIVVGIDGGGLDDLLGVAVLGRERGTARWLLWAHAYAHVSVLRRRKSIASQLIDLAKAGELDVFDAADRVEPEKLHAWVEAPEPPQEPEKRPLGRAEPGASLPPDIAALTALVARILASGLLAQVGIDTAGVGLIVEGLKTIGVQEDEDGQTAPLIGVRQGYTLNGPIKTAERKLADKTLRHAPQALMAWSVGNAKTVQAGNAILITKQASGVAKIDPLMATFNAVAMMSKSPEPAGSVYGPERGFRTFG